jgi:hypothetical protein
MVLMVPVMMVFSSVVRGVSQLVVFMVGGMPEDYHGSVMMVYSSVVRGCETVGCMYGWWYDGWFSCSCDDGLLFCCERI